MRYPGGKGRAFQHLINLMPPHRVYVETHLGGGAVMRRKRPAARNVGIDRDEAALDAWRLLGRDDVELVLGDAADLIDTFARAPGTLVYADPPYWPGARRRARCYRYDYRVEDHGRLLDVLLHVNCSVMLSGYRNDMYEERLAGWHRMDFTNPTQVGMVEESVWMNFEPGSELHDYGFAGRTFREREALRRRRDNGIRKLRRASAVERNAVLAGLAEAFPTEFSAAARRIEQT